MGCSNTKLPAGVTPENATQLANLLNMANSMETPQVVVEGEKFLNQASDVLMQASDALENAAEKIKNPFGENVTVNADVSPPESKSPGETVESEDNSPKQNEAEVEESRNDVSSGIDDKENSSINVQEPGTESNTEEKTEKSQNDDAHDESNKNQINDSNDTESQEEDQDIKNIESSSGSEEQTKDENTDSKSQKDMETVGEDQGVPDEVESERSPSEKEDTNE